MIGAVLVVTIFLGLVLILVTLVQMLYMDTVRVRARELPFLELFRSGLDERLGLNLVVRPLTALLAFLQSLAQLGEKDKADEEPSTQQEHIEALITAGTEEG